VPEVVVAETRHALVVGVSGYEMVPTLNYAAKDARDVATALRDIGFDKVTALEDKAGADARPGRSRVYHHLAELKEAGLDEDDLVLFYFSGHGMSEGKADYLLPIDASNKDLKHTALPMDSIVRGLRETGSRKVVMLIDACREELPTGKSIVGVGANTESVLEKDVDDGLAVLFSCASTQRSFEINGEDIKQGSFTHCMLDAIKDPQISTVGEVATYLERAVNELNGKHGLKQQNPYLLAKPDELMKRLVLFPRLRAPEDIDGYRVFMEEQWDSDQLSSQVFYAVMDFLEDPPYDPRGLRLIRECVELVSSPAQLERTWKHIMRPRPSATVKSQGPIDSA
jgi:hypothetical protein